MHVSLHKRSKKIASGLTLTEMLVAVAILGILSSIAVPNFSRQIQNNCQAEAASNLNLLASYASRFKDIYGEAPEKWPELNSISAVIGDDLLWQLPAVLALLLWSGWQLSALPLLGSLVLGGTPVLLALLVLDYNL